MTVEELNEKAKKQKQMIQEAREGKRPVCPQCNIGHVISNGAYYFHCDRCDMKIRLEPVIDIGKLIQR